MKKKNTRKRAAFLMAMVMFMSLLQTMPGTVTAYAAGGSTPSVTAYATKEQLMNTFQQDGNNTTIGKIVLGKRSTRAPLEWYILGRDTGVGGDNMAILATQYLFPGLVWEADVENNKTFQSSFGVYQSNPAVVAPNHYGAGNVRAKLQELAADTEYFTTAEQSLMQATTVKTQDTWNNTEYTTTDVLYLPNGDYTMVERNKIWAGSMDDILISGIASGADFSWELRTPFNHTDNLSYYKGQTYHGSVKYHYDLYPVTNINLSSVIFASAASPTSSNSIAAGKIEENTAMYLRLDGSAKNIGEAEYFAATGEIVVKKGSTTDTVALVVQGNDGTKDWYYRRLISEDITVNASNIKASAGISDVDLSKCKVWLETTDTNGLLYAVDAVPRIITVSSVEITDIAAPEVGTALDTAASCTTIGVSDTAPTVKWTTGGSEATGNADCETVYTASVTLSLSSGAVWDNTITAALNGKAVNVTKNVDGTITVKYEFPATGKDKLISITAPESVNVANGTAYEDMNLPTVLNIVTKGNTVTTANVVWNTSVPADGSYDPDILTEQTVTLNGTVTCPDTIDTNNVPLTTSITITINAADFVEKPTVNLETGTYAENQTVTLASATEGATIYYTTDGTAPSRENGTEYTEPVAVSGAEGKSITTTIRAIAVKDKMQDSSVEEFTYTINLPEKLLSITVPNAINVANGTAYEDMPLPEKVTIATVGGTVTVADVAWNMDTPANGSYDPEVLTEQTVTLNGVVTCPEGMNTNNVPLTTSITITINAADFVEAPAANLTAGTYAENQTVTLASATEGATIYYTTDGTEPSRENGTEYTEPIVLSGAEGKSITTTIRAIAVKNKMQDSSVEEFTYTINLPEKLLSITAPDALNVANGTEYEDMPLPEKVTIATVGGTVTAADVAWNTETPANGSYDPEVLTEQTVTLNGVVTCPEGMDTNDVPLTTSLTITINAAGVVGIPTVQPAAGIYTENQNVILSSITEGATIYYTTDGTEPSRENGTEYTEPIAVSGTEGQSITTTIRAIAIKDEMQDSRVEEYIYTVNLPEKLLSIKAPDAFTVANGTPYEDMPLPETVDITTVGETVTTADIVWDTKTPASGSYDPKVLTEQTVTLTGIVTCPEGMDTDDIPLTTSLTITISAADVVKAPAANRTAGIYMENQTVTLSTATEGAVIYYTTDGSVPNPASSIKYTGEISLTGVEGKKKTFTIRAIAVKDGMQNSQVADFTYKIILPKKGEINMGYKVEQKGSSIKVKWNKVKNADGYHVYLQYCGEKLNKVPVKTVKSTKNSVTIKRIDGKKINFKKVFKLYVSAYVVEDGKQITLDKTVVIHVVGKKNTRYTNVKSVKLKKSKYTLKAGETAKIKAETVLEKKGKKQLDTGHAPKFRYTTSDAKVAVVSAAGKIKAVGKGTCRVYVHARNGCTKKITVKVK